jgi:thymidylate synthase
MQVIHATSPADAWVKATKHLLENGKWFHDLTEILNVCISIDTNALTDDEHQARSPLFDTLFRQVFGDERIDYAQSVTFIRPPKGGLFNKRTYVYLNNRWKDSYWGRMVAYRDEVNQIENAIYLLSQGKNIKRCEVIVYDPTIDMKNMYKQPCLLSIDFKPRNGNLYTTAFFRSQRVSKSGYADYTALCKLAHYVATESSLKLGTVDVIACSLHLTRENGERAKSLELLDALEKNKWQF